MLHTAEHAASCDTETEVWLCNMPPLPLSGAGNRYIGRESATMQAGTLAIVVGQLGARWPANWCACHFPPLSHLGVARWIGRRPEAEGKEWGTG